MIGRIYRSQIIKLYNTFADNIINKLSLSNSNIIIKDSRKTITGKYINYLFYKIYNKGFEDALKTINIKIFEDEPIKVEIKLERV